MIETYTSTDPETPYQIAMLRDPISADVFIEIEEDNFPNDAARDAQLKAKKNGVIRELIQNLRNSTWYDSSIPE